MPKRRRHCARGSRNGSPDGGDDVFLTREFRDLGGEDQVLRALRELVRDGQLIRLGYGVYGRAEISRLHARAAAGGEAASSRVARQALDKLSVRWEPTTSERDYNEGRSHTGAGESRGCARRAASAAAQLQDDGAAVER